MRISQLTHKIRSENSPKERIIFAHMMKTAGTSVTKKFAERFGSSLHITRGGLPLNLPDERLFYAVNRILSSNPNIAVISGHDIRPYANWETINHNYHWITFLREPVARFISHFYYDMYRSEGFVYKKYQDMQSPTLQEWERIDRTRNYQTRFIAGSEDVDKAISILEKFSFVGICEHFQNSLMALASRLHLDGFDWRPIQMNRRVRASITAKPEIDRAFALEANECDILLYKYALNHIWPRFENEVRNSADKSIMNPVLRKSNEVRFLLSRAMKNDQTEFSIKNVKRFIRRWF